jgi:DNA polymerase IV
MTSFYEVLFIDFNAYFASVEQELQPRLRGKPIAVVPVMTDSTCAIAASYEAKAFGIKTGTPIWEAKRKCPQLHCVLARHQVYVQFHQRIVAEVEQHLPVLKVESIDEMSCQLYGRYRGREGALEMAQQIKRAVQTKIGSCLGSSIGLSTNRFLAKVASDLKKPNGITFLPPEDMPERLSDLEITDLPGIGKNMGARLRAKGIQSIRDLYDCAPKQLRALWGSVEGERFWYALHGVELPREASEKSMVTHSHVLAPEDRPRMAAEKVSQRLLQKAASRLRGMKYRCSRLSLSVRVEHGPRLEISAAHSSTNDSFHLMQAHAVLWQQLMLSGKQPSRLKKVSLALYELESEAAPQQLELFFQAAELPEKQASDAKQQKLSAVLDEVTKRFGRHALTLGLTQQQGSGFTGTKIAFNRIPETE